MYFKIIWDIKCGIISLNGCSKVRWNPLDESKKMNQRDLKASETRSKIIKAAINNFSKYGFHGTTIRDINLSMDGAHGLLYHYFPGGKE